ncbi:hypothetical protein [Mariniblastus fucicola]|uniref:Uncharacterized protein n=1 Tax=Mariniblastus fucicola TaxID=980251 RepID=A0A5B9PKL2_9BACT|nr:hypothetical protein [Mariniblastus fucicola]QEG23201.1 hypothetical protein MFFC18_30970 [Mariniblastus fucicola]
MTLNDEQLDEMLRDVSVPDDLQAKLLQIPSEASDQPVVERASRSYSTLLGTLAVIAATVLLFVYFAPSNVAKSNSDVRDAEAVALLLADLQRNLDSMDEILKAQEIATQQNYSLSIEPVFEPDETVALAKSMSWQSALDKGASFDSVKKELESIVAFYPDTRGAQKARDLLQLNL